MTLPAPAPRRTRNDRRIELAALVGTIVLFGSSAYLRRFEVYSDCISYVDVARTYLAGDWAHALNAYWSPLYSWLLVPVLVVLRPTAYGLYPLVHAVHCILVVASLFSYRWMLEELIAFRATYYSVQRGLVLSDTVLRALAYVAFLWFTLSFLNLTSPDILIASAIYGATGLLLRIGRGQHGPGSYALLGLVCGLGYLAKSIFFPLSFVIFGSALLCRRPWRANWQNVAVAALVFALLATPFAAALSIRKGHLTFGESGQINYHHFLPDTEFKLGIFSRLLLKNRSTVPLALAQGDRIAEHPDVYGFATAPTITFGPHYDPSEWRLGPKTPLTLGILALSCALNAIGLGVVLAISATLLVPLLWLLSKTQWRPKSFPEYLGYSFAVLPSVAGVAAYVPILVNSRYVAPFILVIFAVLLTAVELPDRPNNARLIIRLPRWCLYGTLAAIVAMFTLTSAIQYRTPTNQPWNLAQAFQRQGQLQPGDRLCIFSCGSHEAWAQAGLFQISAEIANRDEFWSVSDQRRAEIYAMLRAQGVVAIIDKSMNGQRPAPGWLPIETSSYGILRLAAPLTNGVPGDQGVAPP
jgi:hypothetical protein